MGRPEEIASIALFPASDTTNFITGASIEVTGGRTCLPLGTPRQIP
jgi:NAD(P)-dependent dehydrogenase (short-subunit alcohol dehydrogenase family)